jgi:hypothetical protein
MRSPIPALLALSAVAASMPAPASAQDRALMQRLQATVRAECRFTQMATGNWQDGGPSFTTAESDLTTIFYDIDVESGTAEAEGRFGASYIVVRLAQGYLHFMQTLSAGPVYVTTILASPTTDGRLKAVQTRHEYTQVSLPGFTSRPEIYLGDCAIETAGN